MRVSCILFVYALTYVAVPSLSLYPLRASDELLSMLFYKEDVQASSLAPTEIEDIDKVITKQFSAISNSLQLLDSITASDYHYQLVTVLNSASEKLVLVKAVSKHLPKWTLLDVGTDLVQLKCVGDQLFCFTVNLSTGSCSEPFKAECN